MDTDLKVAHAKAQRLIANCGSSGLGVAMPAETTTDADGNGFDSSEGDANPFPSASVVVLFAATTSDPEEPKLFAA
jgi:hypothetical protein